MNPLAIWLSVILHIAVLILSFLNLDRFIKNSAIKDNGHVIFDFITIGSKSKAPVLSPINSRASKTKSQLEEEKPKKTNSETTEQTNNSRNNSYESDNDKKQAEKTSNKEKKIPKRPKPKPNDKKKDKTKKQSVNSKNNNKSTPKHAKSTKSGDKALVNLSDKKKKSSGLNQKTKGALDSVVDSALADDDYDNSGLNADEVGDTLTATQVDLIRETIRPCWHFPAGLKDADKLVVDIKMELDHDGYVKTANVVDKSRMASDPGFRTAAESALRAVLDPVCNPLPLPKDKYNEWKDLELSFNPKDWA